MGAATGLAFAGPLLSACGDGGGADLGTLRAGVLLPRTGPLADIGTNHLEAIRLAFSQADNVLGGREVETTELDETAEPERAVANLIELYEQHQNDVVLGVVSSASLNAMRPYVVESGQLLVVTNASLLSFNMPEVVPTAFRVSNTAWANGSVMGLWALEHLGDTAHVVVSGYAAGLDYLEAFRTTFEDNGGTVVSVQEAPPGTSDWAPLLLEIRDRPADLVFGGTFGADSVGFVRQYAEFGLHDRFKLCGPNALISDDVLPAQGEAALGAVMAAPWTRTLDTPRNAEFMSAYDEAVGEPPTLFSVWGYDGVQALRLAMDELDGDLSDSDRVRDAFVGLEIDSPRGDLRITEQHEVIQDIYIMEAREEGGQIQTFVIDEFPDAEPLP